jgi:ADP-ribose pyrophosphatase YjhB (NUDIX family)
MKKSAGILFILKDKALLAHPTNAKWWNSWAPPKGGFELGESAKETASRETLEEIGWFVDPKHLEDFFIVQLDRKGVVWKEVTIFTFRLKEPNDSRLEIKGDLQKEEIDSIEWMSEEQIRKRAHPKYVESIIQAINKK